MKFAIDIGHNAPDRDTGAVGLKPEDILCRTVGVRVIELLKRLDHVVIETCPRSSKSLGASLRHRVSIANAHNVDIFVSIHFNAANFRAYGSEVYALSRAGAAIGRSILDEIVSLGFHDRGVKRAPFYVLKHTTMPAVLVECCFCDSAKDMNLFDPVKIATAIVTGLVGELPPVQNRQSTMGVKRGTWLKKSTTQAANLTDGKKKWLPEGKYQILSAQAAEEGHHYIKMLDESEWFIYTGHCEIT